jgi:hypothetical protein
MKPIFPAVCLFFCLSMTVHAEGVMAVGQEKPATGETAEKSAPAKKAEPVKVEKKRPPIASKSKAASEVVKTELPPAKLDLKLPPQMAQELKPVGTVPLPNNDALLPPMFGEKTSSGPFQLNGRLLNNEMQLQLRNDERREVEGAALDFEFKR